MDRNEKNSSDKNARTTLLNVSYSPNKNNTVKFLEKLAIFIDYAQSFNSNLILLGDFNLNYLKANENASLDTIFIPYNFDVANKIIPKHSKTLIDLMISDISLKDQSNRSFIFTPPIKTDHLVTLFITERRVRNRIIPIKREIYEKNNYSELKFKTQLLRINWESFYRQNTPEEMCKVFCSNIVIAINLCVPPKTIFIRIDTTRVNLAEEKFISELFSSKI